MSNPTAEKRLSPDELLEQWANIVATRVCSELDTSIGLGDGDAAVICDAVVESVLYAALPGSGRELLEKAMA